MTIKAEAARRHDEDERTDMAGRRAHPIDAALAVAEFDLDGWIVAANRPFLDMLGYDHAEIVGSHHAAICDPAIADAAANRRFWLAVAARPVTRGEHMFIGRDGAEVWVQAAFSPAAEADGRICNVTMFAMDITAERRQRAENEAKVEAINRALVVIEFDVDGNILAANDKFLELSGYARGEIVGQHHSLFCTPDYIRSREYREFWVQLNRGRFHSGRFHRVGKFGRDMFIRATYNPILDRAGKPMRIVKYAYDITEQVELEMELSRVSEDMAGLAARFTASIAQIGTAVAGADSIAKETRARVETVRGLVQAKLKLNLGE